MSGLRVMLANGTLYGGGAEHVIGTLARHLRGSGHQVSVAVLKGGGEVQNELLHEGFDVITQLAQSARGLQGARRLAKLVTDRNIDVIHSHDVRSLIDASMGRMLRLHQASHVHTFHFGNYPHLPRKQLALEAVFSRAADQLVAVGHAQGMSLTRALRLPAARVRTVWNGVDAAQLVVRDQPSAASDPPVVGSMSTFGLQKGLPTLLEAAAILRREGTPFRLVLVGEGQMRRELEAQRQRLGLDGHVEFTGWRADAATTLLPTFDVFVQSSYWEAMSIVILEAMAAGRPIVATSVGENTSVLSDEVTALLVPPRDAQALADALRRVLGCAELRQRLGRAARQAYVAEFTGAAMKDRYVELYSDVRARRYPAPR